MDKKQIQKFISERFANIRIVSDISARQLSIKLGQSEQYINQIENGHKLPSVEMLFNFCEAMDITPTIFFNDGYRFPIQYKELTKYLDKLNSEELNEILAVVKRYASKKTEK